MRTRHLRELAPFWGGHARAASPTEGELVTPTRLRMWPPLPPGVWLRRPARAAFPLEAPGSLLLRKARQALYFGIQGLGLRAGDEILMPAYHHGSEVEAFRTVMMTSYTECLNDKRAADRVRRIAEGRRCSSTSVATEEVPASAPATATRRT